MVSEISPAIFCLDAKRREHSKQSIPRALPLVKSPPVGTSKPGWPESRRDSPAAQEDKARVRGCCPPERRRRRLRRQSARTPGMRCPRRHAGESVEAYQPGRGVECIIEVSMFELIDQLLANLNLRVCESVDVPARKPWASAQNYSRGASLQGS